MGRAAWLISFALASAPALAQLVPAPADELLDPEKAFRISARALDERNVEVEFKIANGYYMYRDRFSFATESGKPLADAEIPRGKIKEDQYVGKSETFRDLVRIRVPVSPEDAAKGRVDLKVTSQGCADIGVCYTPLEQLVKVSLPGAGSGFAEDLLAPLGSWSSHLSRVPWALLAASLAAGLALGWASAGAPLGSRAAARVLRLPGWRWWSWALALAFAGGLFGWLGSTLEGRAENPWIAAPLAAGYVACAGFWLHWSQRPGGFASSEGLAPIAMLLAAVLLFAVHRGDAALGAAATLGAWLTASVQPDGRPGASQELALQCVALGMLAAAAWVAAPVLPDALAMLAWSAWLIIAAVLLRAIDSLPEGAPGAMRLAKAVGVAALVWGIAVLIGAASGARDPLRPFEAWRGASEARRVEVPARFERVATLAGLEARIASAGRPVMLDFYADWCVSCKEMEQFTFSDPQVKARMQRMLLLQVDVTKNTAEDKAILKRFKLFGPPGIVFFDARARELRGRRVIGYQPAERFVRVLDAVLDESSKAASS